MAIFVVDRTVSHADFISAMARSHFLRCEAKSDASFIIVSLRWLLVRWKLRSPMKKVFFSFPKKPILWR